MTYKKIEIIHEHIQITYINIKLFDTQEGFIGSIVLRCYQTYLLITQEVFLVQLLHPGPVLLCAGRDTDCVSEITKLWI